MASRNGTQAGKSAYATPTDAGRAKATELRERFQESDLGELALVWSIVYSTSSMVMDADVTVEIQDEFARCRSMPGSLLNWWSNAGTVEKERFFFVVTRALAQGEAMTLFRHLVNHEVDEAWKAVGSAQKAHREDLGKYKALQDEFVEVANANAKLVQERNEAVSAATDLGKRLDEACAFAHSQGERIELLEFTKAKIAQAWRAAQAKLLDYEMERIERGLEPL